MPQKTRHFLPKFLFGEDLESPHSRLWLTHTQAPRFVARIRDTADGHISLRVHPLHELDSTFKKRKGADALVQAGAYSFLLHIDGVSPKNGKHVDWRPLKTGAVPEQLILEDAKALRAFALNITPHKVLAEINRGAFRIIECPEKMSRSFLRLNSRTVLAEMRAGRIRVIEFPASMKPKTLALIKSSFRKLFKSAKAALQGVIKEHREHPTAETKGKAKPARKALHLINKTSAAPKGRTQRAANQKSAPSKLAGRKAHGKKTDSPIPTSLRS